jgi:3'-phosphoadenosine 5'-phosphosulfate sulfotransferase (PAPS reductase)/FAD synthetase
MFLESVIILDAAIAQLAAERLNGQPVLFRDCSLKLEEQLQMAEELSEHFNLLARAVGVAEINLEDAPRKRCTPHAEHSMATATPQDHSASRETLVPLTMCCTCGTEASGSSRSEKVREQFFLAPSMSQVH